MQSWELKIELQVDDVWVADGFDAKERTDEIQEAIERLLPYSYPGEIKVTVTVTKAPSKKTIAKIQGGE